MAVHRFLIVLVVLYFSQYLMRNAASSSSREKVTRKFNFRLGKTPLTSEYNKEVDVAKTELECLNKANATKKQFQRVEKQASGSNKDAFMSFWSSCVQTQNEADKEFVVSSQLLTERKYGVKHDSQNLTVWYPRKQLESFFVLCETDIDERSEAGQETHFAVLKWKFADKATLADNEILYILLIEEKASESSGWKLVYKTANERDPVPVPIKIPGSYTWRLTVVGQRGIEDWAFTQRHISIPANQPRSPPTNPFVIDMKGNDKKSVDVWVTWQQQGPYCAYQLSLVKVRIAKKVTEGPPLIQLSLPFLTLQNQSKNVSSSIFQYPQLIGLESYRIQNLSLNSTFNLTITQRAILSGRSEKLLASLFLTTPSCLKLYQYNFSICGPPPPRKVLVDVDRIHKSENVTVNLQWTQPSYTNLTNSIVLYEIQICPVLQKTNESLPQPWQITVPAIRPELRKIIYVGQNIPLDIVIVAVTRGGKSTGVYTHHPGKTVRAEKQTQPLGGNSKRRILSIVSIFVFIMAVSMCAKCKVGKCTRHQQPEAAAVEEPGVWKRIGDTLYEETFPKHLWELPILEVTFKRKIKQTDTTRTYKGLVRREFLEGFIGKRGQSYDWITLDTKQKVYFRMTKIAEDVEASKLTDFCTGVKVFQKLDFHPNVVSLFGTFVARDGLFFASSFCIGGNVQEFLQRVGKCATGGQLDPEKVYWSDDSMEEEEDFLKRNHFEEDYSVKTTDLLWIARQVASGMAFLQDNQIVHGDLSVRNVLFVGDYLHVKVANMRLFKLDMPEIANCGNMEVLKIQSLETLDEGVLTSESDLWSFGILFWELMNLGRGEPYKGIECEALSSQLSSGYRLSRPPNCPKPVDIWMRKCWMEEPRDRPTFLETRSRIEELIRIL